VIGLGPDPLESPLERREERRIEQGRQVASGLDPQDLFMTDRRYWGEGRRKRGKRDGWERSSKRNRREGMRLGKKCGGRGGNGVISPPRSFLKLCAYGHQ